MKLHNIVIKLSLLFVSISECLGALSTWLDLRGM